MSAWPRGPKIYEINTWVWLSDLSEKSGTSVNLSCVPSADWDAIANFGFDAVWLMGVWERSPAGIAIANCNNNLLEDFRRALPDFFRSFATILIAAAQGYQRDRDCIQICSIGGCFRAPFPLCCLNFRGCQHCSRFEMPSAVEIDTGR